MGVARSRRARRDDRRGAHGGQRRAPRRSLRPARRPERAGQIDPARPPALFRRDRVDPDLATRVRPIGSRGCSPPTRSRSPKPDAGMDPTTAIGSVFAAFGLAGAAGLNAWLPLFASALLDRLGVVDLGAPFDQLSTTTGLVVLGTLLVLDFVGDKVPAV